MDLTQLSCEDFLSRLASKAPAPGGGGASALVGAAGVALGNMVGNLTTGKKKYAAVEEEILALNARAETLRKRLEALVQADADAFTPLAAAYGLPRETPEQQARKAAVLAEALDGACAVPLDIMDACCEGIRLAADYAEKGSVLAVSDAAGRRSLPVRGKPPAGLMQRKGTYMSTILKGAPVVAAMNEANAARCAALREKGVVPTLAVVRVGAREDDLSYEKGVMARCAKVGVEVKQFLLPADASQEELLRVIADINADAAIHGCLLFRPLPKQFDDRTIRAALSPEKDIDGITDGSLAGVFTNTAVGYPPCTAQACLEILKFYNVPLSGRRAVVVGRSLVVGKPAAMMLDRENATVTLCNSRTQNLPDVCREADVVVVAMGRMGFIGAEHLRAGQVVVDVGIHVNEEGKLCGDVRFGEAEPVVEAITPVPGGVGTVTTSVLVSHVVEAAEKSV